MDNLKNIIERGLLARYLERESDEIKEALQEHGVNIENESQFIRQYVKRLKFTNAAMVSKEKNNALLEKIVNQFQEAINKNIDKPIATLKHLIESKQMSVQFRNLDKLTPDEIKEIIKGKNLVDLMDELDD